VFISVSEKAVCGIFMLGVLDCFPVGRSMAEYSDRLSASSLQILLDQNTQVEVH